MMYTRQGSLQRDRDQFVVQYAPLVKRIAYQLMARLPASVQIDDLIQNGMMGLLDALTKYEDCMGAQFETYAVQRIRGSMLDGLRENDWMPRSIRKEIRRVETALHKLEHQVGRPPTEKELAEALEMPLADYQKLLSDARGHQLFYIEDLNDGQEEDYLDRHALGGSQDPLAILEDASLRNGLVTAIAALPDREKMMMALYYEQDLNLKEIGEVMGVTESRVCQMHSQAVIRLRASIIGENKPLERARRGRKPKQPQP